MTVPRTTALLAALTVALLLSGCQAGTSSDEDQSPEAESGSAPDARSTPEPSGGRPARLAGVLARRYEVAVVSGTQLPPRAVAGLRVDHPGDGVGFVYRYRSPQIARSAAPMFLGLSGGRGPRPRFGGVTGCGSHLWFTDSGRSQDQDWEVRVDRALERIDRGCRGGRSFGVIS